MAATVIAVASCEERGTGWSGGSASSPLETHVIAIPLDEHGSLLDTFILIEAALMIAGTKAELATIVAVQAGAPAARAAPAAQALAPVPPLRLRLSRR
eukprot:6200113-Pleurochrysis_carterae.AAC.2